MKQIKIEIKKRKELYMNDKMNEKCKCLLISRSVLEEKMDDGQTAQKLLVLQPLQPFIIY
jgi:hypothetical protein